MHVSALTIAPGPPARALDVAADRLNVLMSREWGDYYRVGGDHVHAWRARHANPSDSENIPGVEWCERIGSPIPEELLTAIYISPASRVFWSPIEREDSAEWPGWVKRMNNNVLRGARTGCCVVVADVHC